MAECTVTVLFCNMSVTPWNAWMVENKVCVKISNNRSLGGKYAWL